MRNPWCLRIAAALSGCMLLCVHASAAVDPFLLGDLNCDRALSVSDLVLHCRLLAEKDGLSLTAQGIQNADCDRDGILTLSDMRQISSLLSAGTVEAGTWAKETGYKTGLLISQGASGLNQDAFRMSPDCPGYRSGRIVVGDSRCVQLGIYELHTGRADCAVFGVWGGHYASSYNILSDADFSAIQKCFTEQIRVCGHSNIFLFATVNDFDYSKNQNSAYIRGAVSAAERLQGMRCSLNGNTYQPHLTVVGFDGCRKSGSVFGIAQQTFNRYVPDYNSALKTAVQQSSILSQANADFTTVPEITGDRTAFLSDGLHYADSTLWQIMSFLLSDN